MWSRSCGVALKKRRYSEIAVSVIGEVVSDEYADLSSDKTQFYQVFQMERIAVRPVCKTKWFLKFKNSQSILKEIKGRKIKTCLNKFFKQICKVPLAPFAVWPNPASKLPE